MVTVAQPHLDVHPRRLTMARLPSSSATGGPSSQVPGELTPQALGANLSPG